MVEADVSKIDLGLSQENRKQLLDTHVIFHGAATVRFNESLRIAVNINVRGTKQLLLLAKEMPNFKVGCL
jgi:fatty acyl-CoA reductase